MIVGPVPPRRSPKAAVVTLGRSENGHSYAEILRKTRARVSLTELAIEDTKIRTAVTGGVIVEISGENMGEKADALAAYLVEVLKEDRVRIARPIKKAEIRVSNFDDSIAAQEVVEEIARIGGCLVSDIRADPLRFLRNGLCSM